MKASTTPGNERLISLDALRGFSMFWLLGGTALARLLFKDSPPDSLASWINLQFTHVDWEGFHFYDYIFPLFLFCIGVSVPISIEKRLQQGFSKGAILRQAIFRLSLMIFFGWWVNGNLLTWDPAKFTLSYSVLMMLGLGYLIAVGLVLFFHTKSQILITIGILVGYWILQCFVPVPGFQSGEFVRNGIFSDWFYNETIAKLGPPWKSPIGQGFPIVFWNCGSTAMLGVFACRILSRPITAQRRIRTLILVGILLLIAGWLWSYHLPIVKNRWTSSYVLWCSGLSWMLLGIFYMILDVLKWRKWAVLFLALGANSITAYLISTIFMAPFRSVASILFSGLSKWMPEYYHTLFMTFAAYGLAWWLFIWLYHKKIHIRL